MEAVRTSETSVDNHFTRQYIPEDNSEHHTRRRENLKSHMTYQLHSFVVRSRLNVTESKADTMPLKQHAQSWRVALQ
jgi:hypothetical protein